LLCFLEGSDADGQYREFVPGLSYTKWVLLNLSDSWWYGLPEPGQGVTGISPLTDLCF